MKTSNKLLILLFVLLLSVPLIMMMSFKAAIKNNRFIVKNMNGQQEKPFEKLKPFKVILLEGDNAQLLRCHVKQGDQFSYKYYHRAENGRGEMDSSSVISFRGDTLVIRHRLILKEVNQGNGNYDYSMGEELDLTFPGAVPIIANGATLNLDSSAANLGAMTIELNKAVLNINGVETKYTVKVRENVYRDSIVQRTTFPALTIKATASEVNIQDFTAIGNLKLNLGNNAKLNLHEGVMIDSISGQVSDESVVNAPYRFTKALH